MSQNSRLENELENERRNRLGDVGKPDLYETYIRTADGETYHPEDFKKGLEQFLSDDGYRLSINIDGVVITLRRGHVSDDMRYLDEMLPQESLNCAVTIKGLRLEE